MKGEMASPPQRRGSTVGKAEFLSHFAAAAVRSSPRKVPKSMCIIVPGAASEVAAGTDGAATTSGGGTSVLAEGDASASRPALMIAATPPPRKSRTIAGLSLEIGSGSRGCSPQGSPTTSTHAHPIVGRAATARKLGRLKLGGMGLSINADFNRCAAPQAPLGPGRRQRPGGINSLPSISASRSAAPTDDLPEVEGADFVFDPAQADLVVDALRGAGIACFCVDFDRTMVSCHTYGRWHRSPEELGRYVRPVFRALIPRLVSAGCDIAVVTFSKQDHLIMGVLRHVFGEEIAERVHLRTNSYKFRRRRGSAWDTGKQLHIESVIEEVNSEAEKKAEALAVLGGAVAPSSPPLVMAACALIDDDLRNINVARENSVHAHHFKNDHCLCVGAPPSSLPRAPLLLAAAVSSPTSLWWRLSFCTGAR